jgi:hypothetical protein
MNTQRSDRITERKALWVLGNFISVVIGGLVGGQHGAPIGIAVGYALMLLVDIRAECEKKAGAE